MLVSVEFIEAPFFTQVLPAYMGADDYRELQLHLARDPDAGDVIHGTGGFRKLRWPDRRRGKGKREAADLSKAERRALKSAIDEELRQRADSRRVRGK